MKFYTNNSNCGGLNIGEGNKIINVKITIFLGYKYLKAILNLWIT
jgi:hypothetical protein